MKKLFLLCCLGCFLCACTATNPPTAKVAKGNWENLITEEISIKGSK